MSELSGFLKCQFSDFQNPPKNCQFGIFKMSELSALKCPRICQFGIFKMSALSPLKCLKILAKNLIRIEKIIQKQFKNNSKILSNTLKMSKNLPI